MGGQDGPLKGGSVGGRPVENPKQNVPNLRRKLSELTTTDRETFALRDRLSALTRWEYWALIYARVDATAAPLSPKPCREVQTDMPPNGQAGCLLWLLKALLVTKLKSGGGDV